MVKNKTQWGSLVIFSITLLIWVSDAYSSPINGDFETGNLTGWSASGINGGFAAVVQEGTSFSANNTLGLAFNGDFAVIVRSSGPAPTDSIGILTSDPFVAGSGIGFRALSENSDLVPAPDPVSFGVRLLDSVGNVLLLQTIETNIVTLGIDPRNSLFSTHSIDTAALAGQIVRLEFQQHTNFAGNGFFTLIDDVALAPIPEPATLLLFGTTAGLGLARWRQRRRNQQP